jgi:hypothetical protein
MVKVLPLPEKPANLSVILVEKGFTPGAVVSGRVILEVLNDTLDGDSLIVRLIGQESTVVMMSRKERSRQVSVFVEIPQTLAHSPSGTFQKGQHEYPFIFTLPSSGLLTSFYANSRGNECRTEYRIEAQVVRKGIFKWDVRSSADFNVWPFPPACPDTYPVTVPVTGEKAHFFWCRGTGTLQMGISCSSASLAIGEEFDISYVLKNNSTSTIQSVVVGIVQNVTFQANGVKHVFKQFLFEKRLGNNELNELGIEVSPSGKQKAKLLETNRDWVDSQKQLDSNRFSLTGKIMENGSATPFAGKLIQVIHTLELSVQTSFGTSNPLIYAPITIYRKGTKVNSTVNSDVFIPERA